MNTMISQSIALDFRGRASHGAALILSDLVGKRPGKCPCYISATTGISERLVYEFLAELLSREWVEVIVPADAEERLRTLIERTLGEVRRLPIEGRVRHWTDFFRKLGGSESAPRYYIRLTRLGESELVRFAAA